LLLKPRRAHFENQQEKAYFQLLPCRKFPFYKKKLCFQPAALTGNLAFNPLLAAAAKPSKLLYLLYFYVFMHIPPANQAACLLRLLYFLSYFCKKITK
jgi:hypothetical protein